MTGGADHTDAEAGDDGVVPGGVRIFRRGVWRDYGFFLIASGYLVWHRRVLLVYHNRFNLWVPPGGHVEAGDTFARTAEREFEEETGIAVKALSAGPSIRRADANASPEPLPFHVDVEREGFAKPALVQFFFVRALGEMVLRPQRSEVNDCQWFDVEDLDMLPTFNQVRQLSLYALATHPDAEIGR
jgi:8-oxo-dGTP pyrophosphatase MutT (NUDIX family)